MSCKSVLNKLEMVENKDRKFGSNLEYFPVWILRTDGTQVPALFTRFQINEAVERASNNPEDIPERAGWISRIFG